MKLFRNTSIRLVVAVFLISIEIQNEVSAEVHWHSTCDKRGIPKHNYSHATSRFGSTGFAVANAVVFDSTQRRKPFHFRATALKVDHIQLDQIGLAILESDGQMVATGRFTHGGGDGGLIGNNVTIRIRAFIAAAADPIQIPPDAVVVWSSECSVWVPRGQKHISLTPSENKLCRSGEIAGNFDRITHLEIEMEYRRDR